MGDPCTIWGMKKSIHFFRAAELCEEDGNMGICLACGYEQEGCEPDARGYDCEECGEPEVYGAEEILMMLG